MIDLRKSAELNNMEPIELYSWFKKYPGSQKYVIRMCDNCWSEGKIQYFQCTDLCGSCAGKKRFEDPLEHEKYSIAQKKRYEDPNEHEKLSISTKKRYEDPKEHEKSSNAQKESVAKQKASQKMIGGNDIVNHHFLYDHSDLSLNTVKMTRSDHASLHNRLRYLGYKVPHINEEI